MKDRFKIEADSTQYLETDWAGKLRERRRQYMDHKSEKNLEEELDKMGVKGRWKNSLK